MPAINQTDINAIANHAITCERHGRLEEAIVYWNRAIALRPDIGTLHYNLGIILQKIGRAVEAERSYRTAISLNPTAKSHYNLAMLLAVENRLDDAITEYRLSLALDPNSWETLNNLGSLLVERGGTKEATDLFERARRITPLNAGIYHNLARAKTFDPDDPIITAMEQLCGSANLSLIERIYLHFALGKAYGDVRQYNFASRHLLIGNRLKRSLGYYDETTTLSAFSRVMQIFTPSLLENLYEQPNTRVSPIFILGMPRSGTTLVEQILASHPLVVGSGESLQIEAAFAKISSGQTLSNVFPDVVRQLGRDDFVKLGTACLQSMQAVADQAHYVVDKSISNFALAGLIRLSVPRARMVHIRRDPIDTCLSCFSTLFAGNSQPFTYDLGEVGRYFSSYRKLMEHWRRVLPSNILLEVDYEDMIENLEVNVRRILEFCGLPWHDGCLEFYKTNRAVKTASAMQVRKPIYRTSLGRWRKCIDLIEPLQQVLA